MKCHKDFVRCHKAVGTSANQLAVRTLDLTPPQMRCPPGRESCRFLGRDVDVFWSTKSDGQTKKETSIDVNFRVAKKNPSSNPTWW